MKPHSSQHRFSKMKTLHSCACTHAQTDNTFPLQTGNCCNTMPEARCAGIMLRQIKSCISKDITSEHLSGGEVFRTGSTVRDRLEQEIRGYPPLLFAETCASTVIFSCWFSFCLNCCVSACNSLCPRDCMSRLPISLDRFKVVEVYGGESQGTRKNQKTTTQFQRSTRILYYTYDGRFWRQSPAAIPC